MIRDMIKMPEIFEFLPGGTDISVCVEIWEFISVEQTFLSVENMEIYSGSTDIPICTNSNT